MSTQTSPEDHLGRAIETWLRYAYEGAAPPQVLGLVDAVRSRPPGAMLESRAFERSPDEAPTRYALRLGSGQYPFMKLVVERLPNHDAWLFHADTHDRHICPAPDDADHEAFVTLMARNRALAVAIEDAWRAEGIATFRAFLEADLARRRHPARAP